MGLQGRQQGEENQWLVEVDMNKEAERKEGHDSAGRQPSRRKERVKRNERRMHRNLKRGEPKK